jgi:aerobic-type carbon monoxide dehydrogenase small subunit (CoxS/CutS family)
MTQSIELHVNGSTQQVPADEREALLYVLRNDFDCKGVRFGCGVGHCGACTVWVNGRAAQSCDMPVAAAVGHRITTVEQLRDDAVGRVVLQTFVELQAAQCGYCINGILMSTAALLHRDTAPGEEQLQEMLHRHLCRCGAHTRILAAIHLAAQRVREGTAA